MDFKSVKQLADLMEERGLTNIEVCEGEHKISLSKEIKFEAAPVAMQSAVQAPPQEAPPVQAAEQPAPGEVLEAPLVGIVYLAPNPDAAPFVQVGCRVKKGQTLCIVEAMKVMNEFTAPRDGEIASVCVENGQMVEFGQCMFRLL
ncbi:MAG: acetyl-CoA carboxylase biotin carboxyl carrier protein [Oscillospiraceae bacterium]